MTDGTNNGIDGYSQTRVGDHTILTPKDKKASVYQKVTPREQYAVARDVANRAINEINAIRGDRPSSFTGGINDANIAARMQAAETYGDTLSGRQPVDFFRPIVGIGSDVPVRGAPVRELIDADRVRATAPQISEITGDYGYGPSIRYPEPDTSTPTPSPSENYDSWINQQYNELLGRDAGTEGLNYWTGDLTRGQTKDQVRANIMLSDEFKNRLKLVTDYRNEFGTDPDESWLDERVGPGGVWLMEGYDDVDVSDPETFLRAFGTGGRNPGKTGGRGLGGFGNKGGNKGSSGSNKGKGGQGNKGRTSTKNNPASNKGNRGGFGKGGASTGRQGGQGNKGRGM